MIDLHSEAKKMFDSVGLSDRKSYSLASSLNINASHRLRIFFFSCFRFFYHIQHFNQSQANFKYSGRQHTFIKQLPQLIST